MKWLLGLALGMLIGWGVAHARPERTQLPDGLQLITERIAEMPLVALEVWVRAGTAYETPETSGVAHLLEHLLFKGTPDHPKGALDWTFERAGGLLEASTERDWVRFRATVLKDRWQEPLRVLLAHLLNPSLPETELERERSIILNDEYALHLLSPVRVARYALFAEQFPNHPYGLPLLGEPERLRTLSIASIRAFHQERYRPENIVVVLVGALSHEEAVRVVGSLPTSPPLLKREGGEENLTPPALLSASREGGEPTGSPSPFTERGSGGEVNPTWIDLRQPSDILAVALPAPPASQVDALLITELLRVALAEPYLGLLYARFDETETRLPFEQLHSEYLPRAQLGLVAFYFLPPVPELPDWRTRVRQRWQTALTRLQSGQARAWLEQAKAIAIARHQQQMANPMERARLYGLYATLGVPSLPEEWVGRLQALSPEQVESYLAKLLEGNLLPKVEGTRLSTLQPLPERLMPELGSPVRLRLANGIRVLHVPLQNSESLHLQILIHTPAEIRQPKGVTELTARLLFTTTQNETEATLGYRMARSGGTLRVFWEPNAIRVAVVARPGALQNLLSLLAEGILRPEFTPEALQRAKAIASAERRWAEGAREWNAYTPLSDYATDEALERITPAQVRRFYQACFRPENLVVVSAGNLRAEQVATSVNQFLGSGWEEGAQRGFVQTPILVNASQTSMVRSSEGLHYWAYRHELPVSSAEQVVAGLVYQAVLSGGKGARLFRSVREAQGWGYDFGGQALMEQGRLLLLGFVQAGRASKGVPETLNEPIRPEEVERAKAYLLGNWHRNRMELGEYLRQLAEAEMSGIGMELAIEFPKWLEAISVESVQKLWDRGTVAPSP